MVSRSLIVIMLIIAGIILLTWYETSTQQNVAQSDLSKIKMFPGEGDHLLNKILLVNYSLDYTTLKSEDICLPYSANPGDPGIVIRGIIKNEYDRDYWIILGAAAYDSNENLLRRSLDSGPICGIITRHVESNMTGNFELHLKYNNIISKINISGSISEIAPP